MIPALKVFGFIRLVGLLKYFQFCAFIQDITIPGILEQNDTCSQGYAESTREIWQGCMIMIHVMELICEHLVYVP